MRFGVLASSDIKTVMFWDVTLGIVTELYQHAGSILEVEQASVWERTSSVFFYFFVSCSFLNTFLLHLKVFVSLLYFSSPHPCTPIPTHAMPAPTPPVPFLEPPSYTGSPTTPGSSFLCPYPSHSFTYELFSYHADGNGKVFWNGKFLPDYVVLYSRRHYIDSVIHKQCEFN